MPDATNFWKPWESHVTSYNGVHRLIDDVFRKWTATGRVFAWRGIVDSTWALHSSLYRRLADRSPLPDEDHFCQMEKSVMANLHRWGLHNSDRGRLSYMAQLAMLQHFGAPTRLIDVTFNPYIGLWFAVEQKYDQSGRLKHEDSDGRLFAIDVTHRLINEDSGKRSWEDKLNCPWDPTKRPSDWRTRTFAWRPPPIERRIAAQNGGFLLGGVPSSGSPSSPLQWLKAPSGTVDRWRIDQVRSFVSVPLRVHKIDPPVGGVGASGQPVFTIRISASAKQEIRDRLEKHFGYNHSRIYPDFTGFASYGTSTILATA